MKQYTGLYRKHIVAIFIALFTVFGMNAQIQIKQMPGYNQSGYIPQRICFEMSNAGVPTQVIIQVEIKDNTNDASVVTLVSPEITVNTGTMQVLPAFVEQFKTVSIIDSSFNGYLQLKNGSYTAQVIVRNSKEDFEYGTSIMVLSVLNNLSKKEKQKLITTSGTGQLTGVYATRQQSFSSMPPAYAQANFSPSVTVAGVPVSANINLSTLQNAGQQHSNTIYVDYNSAALKAMLKKKLEETLKKNADFQKLTNWKNAADLNQLESYKKLFENDNVKKELAQLANIDSLKGMADSLQYVKDLKKKLNMDSIGAKLADTTAIMKTFNIDSTQYVAFRDSVYRYNDSINKLVKRAEKAMDMYKTLKAKKDGYEKIAKNKDELEKKLKSIGAIDSVGNKVKNYQSKVGEIAVNIDNPDYFINKLKENNLLRSLDKVLMAINKINIGTSYPKISTLTLSGVRVNGINVELAPKNIFASFTYGTILDAVQTFNPTNATYKRKIYSSTIGYGQSEGPHLHFTVLSASDDSSSITPRDSIFTTYKLPQSNYVIGTDFRLPIFKTITIVGEVTGSQTTRDQALVNPDSGTYATLTPVSKYTQRNWISNILNQRAVNANIFTGYAYSGNVELTLFKGKTKLSGGVKQVSNGYRTFGVPFLASDMLMIEGKVTQKIWKNRIQISGTLKRNEDNLSGTKLSTTRNYQLAGDIRIAIPKWPTFRASYVPLVQQNDTLKLAINILNINTGYQYKILKVKNIVSANYNRQNSYSASNSSLTFFSENALLSNTTILPKGFSFTLSANYINFQSHDLVSTKTTNIALSGTFGLFKQRLSNTVGATLIKNSQELRYGFFYNASLAVNKFLAVTLRLENNQYNSIIINPVLSVPNFSEFMGQLSLSVKW